MYDILGRITELRKSRNWSVYHLAQMSGIPQSTISTWYAKKLYPPVDKIEIVCNALGISLAEFFSNDKLPGEQRQYFDLNQKWVLLSSKEREAVMTVIDTFVDKN